MKRFSLPNIRKNNEIDCKAGIRESYWIEVDIVYQNIHTSVIIFEKEKMKIRNFDPSLTTIRKMQTFGSVMNPTEREAELRRRNEEIELRQAEAVRIARDIIQTQEAKLATSPSPSRSVSRRSKVFWSPGLILSCFSIPLFLILLILVWCAWGFRWNGRFTAFLIRWPRIEYAKSGVARFWKLGRAYQLERTDPESRGSSRWSR